MQTSPEEHPDVVVVGAHNSSQIRGLMHGAQRIGARVSNCLESTCACMAQIRATRILSGLVICLKFILSFFDTSNSRRPRTLQVIILEDRAIQVIMHIAGYTTHICMRNLERCTRCMMRAVKCVVSLRLAYLCVVLYVAVAIPVLATWNSECGLLTDFCLPTLPTIVCAHQALQPSLADVHYSTTPSPAYVHQVLADVHRAAPPRASCGVEAVNGLLGVDGAITDVQLLTLHLDLKLPNEAHIWYGACARVLVGVLGEQGLELRAKRDYCGATNGLNPDDTHILLNNSQHWTSMRLVGDEQWEHHDGCNVTVISPIEVDALIVASQWSFTFHKSRATSRQETLESKLCITNVVGQGKTKRKRKRTENVAACDNSGCTDASAVDLLDNLLNATARFSYGFGLKVATDMPKFFKAREDNTSANLQLADANLRAGIERVLGTGKPGAIQTAIVLYYYEMATDTPGESPLLPLCAPALTQYSISDHFLFVICSRQVYQSASRLWMAACYTSLSVGANTRRPRVFAKVRCYSGSNAFDTLNGLCSHAPICARNRRIFV